MNAVNCQTRVTRKNINELLSLWDGDGFSTIAKGLTSERVFFIIYEHEYHDNTTLEPWKSLAAVQNILFPNDGNGPSIEQIHATHYLRHIINSGYIEPETCDLILNGMACLNQISRTLRDVNFSGLTYEQQYTLIGYIVERKLGEKWLAILVDLILEALLADPIHGTNPKGIGWDWLEHQLAFPRPEDVSFQAYFFRA